MFSNALLNAIQGKGWLYSVDFDNDTNPIGLELETCSPAGENFLLSFNVKDDDDFLSQLFDAYMNFDTEQHAIENYGMRGAPGLRVLLDDAEAIEGEIQRLWCELSKVKETV